jgi:hypothetical protein
LKLNISVQKCLEKIEEELATVNEKTIREKVYSIKILCELILDEKQIKTESPAMLQAAPKPFIQQPALQTVQPKKLVVDDEANGDSLFDF